MNNNYAKFYSPSENLAVDKVIVKFKGGVIFRQYIPKKRKENVSVSKYKNCVMKQGARAPWGCTWVKTRTPPLTT